MDLIISRAISDIGDRRRQEMISGRIESALNDFNEGRLNEAILKYRFILEIDPGNETVSELLASAEQSRSSAIAERRTSAIRLQNQGDLAGATAEWGRILTLDENHSEARRRIDELKGRMQVNGLIAEAVAFINDGKYAEAINDLNRAQGIKPDDKTIKSLLSEARTKSAPPTTIEDIRANSEHWNRYLSGLESYQKSEYQQAIEIWSELEKIYPNNPDLRKNITQARQRLSAEGETPQE
jgi:tetratricopeptide (TPR) repeat protein